MAQQNSRWQLVTPASLLRWVQLGSLVLAFATCTLAADSPSSTESVAAADRDPRPPRDDAELGLWLENMLRHHRYSPDEIRAATGLEPVGVEAAIRRLGIRTAEPVPWQAGEPLRVLPYPGGRHPRLGFRDGAIRPQRETKFSVFTPWDPLSYVVIDLPEAIWCQHGLLYLAHTHVPTMWTKQGVQLEQLEWSTSGNGQLQAKRRLPNGVQFGAQVQPRTDSIQMELWLTNDSDEPLTDLRVQNCVMLARAAGFEAQTNDNKVFRAPYVAVRSENNERWIITAWQHCQRAWGNAPCPCLHSDPQFPDCPPGATRRLRGWLSFYVGSDLEGELKRIERTGWRGSDSDHAESNTPD